MLCHSADFHCSKANSGIHLLWTASTSGLYRTKFGITGTLLGWKDKFKFNHSNIPLHAHRLGNLKTMATTILWRWLAKKSALFHMWKSHCNGHQTGDQREIEWSIRPNFQRSQITRTKVCGSSFRSIMMMAFFNCSFLSFSLSLFSY